MKICNVLLCHLLTEYCLNDNITNIFFLLVSGKNVLTFRFRPEIIKGGKPVLRINLFLYVSKKDNKESGTESFPSTFPTSRNLGNVKTNSREKGKKIKILIFLVTASGNRIQKLAELKKSINRSQWEKLGLPVSLISKVAEANSNNTLYLRVECKKCNKKTQLSIPTKCIRRHRLRKNKKDKREPRSNKNCSHSSAATADVHKPFIVVESSDAISRNKRNAKPEPACEDVGVNKTGITTPGCCKQIKTFVQFADLNLSNAIVSPSGFYLVTCTGECTTASPVKTRSQYRRSEDINLNVRSSLAKGYHRILRHLYHRHRYSPGHPHHRSRNWYNEKWTRSLSPSANTCAPVQTEELILLHFTQDQTLVRSHIPNFLVTKCGCKGDRSTNSK
uniref:TGF-beta family profile domain-containing protein n=1 Tax=Biomphalaria glabrata TaxID=6526 RepID=A0A2C9KRJ5_BIOGL